MVAPVYDWAALRSEARALFDTSHDLLARHFAQRVASAMDHYDIRSPKQDADGRWGNWVWTRSGGRFYPLDPRPSEVRLDDIVWSLSHMNRYGGHASEPYSVLTHSILVHDIVADLAPHRGVIPTLPLLRAAVLHDSPEAYIEDIRKPLKGHLWGYAAMERDIARAIGEHFGIGGQIANPASLVKDADLFAAILEARVLCGDPQDWNFPKLEPALEEVLTRHQIILETPLAARMRFAELNLALGLA